MKNTYNKLFLLLLLIALVLTEILVIPLILPLTRKTKGVYVVHDGETASQTQTVQAEDSVSDVREESAKETVSLTDADLEEMALSLHVIFVGDSRTVQMNQVVGDRASVWIAESGQGYAWYVNTALSQINAKVTNGSNLLINLGVNDVSNIDKYIERVNRSMDDWTAKGVTVYYASVNPVGSYRDLSNEAIDAFNEKLFAKLDERVIRIDSNAWLKEEGFSTSDGLHYRDETYKRLYAYYLLQIQKEQQRTGG